MPNLTSIELMRYTLRVEIMKIVDGKFKEYKVKGGVPTAVHNDLFYEADDFADSFAQKVITSIEKGQKKR